MEYFWSVVWGLINLAENNEITVDWGDTNAESKVNVFAKNSANCSSDTVDFPVRINALLEVPLPIGLDSMCLNLATDITYEVGYTNGSVYDWSIVGGEIASGQGEHKITVNWLDLPQHQLSLSETSVTIDTVCTGYSPTLDVKTIKDTTMVSLQYVTVKEDEMLVFFDVNDFRGLNGQISLNKRAFSDINWTVPAKLTQLNSGIYRDRFVNVGKTNYEYFLEAINSCQQDISTPIHTSILLDYEKDTLNNKIYLKWNPYFAWVNQGYYFELLRKLEEGQSFEVLSSLSSNENQFAANAEAGFLHQYFVRAISPNGFMSNSNIVSINFEHAISFIPNIITPNGDTYNDSFVIPKIHLYPDAELIIVDRWGREVFKGTNYKNDWSAETENRGVYYYSLYLPKTGKNIKGIISVLK